MKPPISIVGQIFGRLTCIQHAGKTESGMHLYLCRCECGNEKVVLRASLVGGKTKSCGCFRKACNTERLTKHGLTNSYYFKLWGDIKRRCYCKTHVNYKNYGKRGIVLDSTWRSSFPAFYSYIIDSLGERPSKGYSLDRIDNAGNYEPGNIRWAVRTTQSYNRRNKKPKFGVRGVGFINGKFTARISKDNKRIFLGRFSTLEEAKKAYETAAVQLYGSLVEEFL